MVDRTKKEFVYTLMTVPGSADANTTDARRTKTGDKNFFINLLSPRRVACSKRALGERLRWSSVTESPCCLSLKGFIFLAD